MLDCCLRIPDRIAFVSNDGSGKSYRYSEVHEIVTRISGGLKNLGFCRGDKAAIISPNCPEWGMIYLATLAAGGIFVPFDSSWKEEEIAHTLDVSQVKFIFCSNKWFPIVNGIAVRKNLKITSVCIDSSFTPNLSDLLDSKPYISNDISPNDPAAIIYTSGTSGEPKGVILTHRNILADIEGTIRALDLPPDDTCLSILPLHHTLESTCGFLTSLIVGRRIVYAQSLKSKDLLNDIKKYNVVCIIGVPLLYEKIHNAITKRIEELPIIKKIFYRLLYKLSGFFWILGIKSSKHLFKSMRKRAGLESVKMMVCGGAPLPPKIAEWFNLIGFDFMVGYGLSECAPVVTLHRPNGIKFDSVGSPIPGVEIEISNPNAEGIGEIKVKGENTSPGYIDNPQATKELLKDGWLHTGDLGKMVKGQLYITGRKKNLIVSAAGKNIYPEEIEAALHLSPFILESIVFGRKKENRMGEEVHAIIVPNLDEMRSRFPEIGSSPDHKIVNEVIETEVQQVNNRLADYKRLIRFEIKFEELEKTSTRKIRRTVYK